MTVPDEAVEAAAQALYVAEHGPWISGGGITPGGTPWGTSTESDRHTNYLQRAGAALAAAAPFIAAQALARDELFEGLAEEARSNQQGKEAVRELSNLIAAKAQAWDEGYEVGEDWGSWAEAPVRQEPAKANPYRSGM